MNISELRERPSSNAMTVSALNEYIKARIEGDPLLGSVSVTGELSNFKLHSSGHLYFTLKDEGAEIRCVMFRSRAASLRFQPEDGMKVILRGSVGVYTKGGSYQFYADAMQPDGIGALYLAYEQRKKKLEEEGLFDEDRKRPIPRLPMCIGVVTSPTGAVIRDIMHVAGRRFPLAKILLYPALVQGANAEESLLRGIDYFDRTKCCDVVIIGRGGGSMEDLWAFNGEKLARRIAAAEIPIISAVGHETDYTICDFVADLRAPTPSAAAEHAVPDAREISLRLDELVARCAKELKDQVARYEETLRDLSSRPCLRDGEGLFSPDTEKLRLLQEKLTLAFGDRIGRSEQALGLLSGKLDALSPLSVLSRGYAVVRKEGKIVRSAKEVREGDLISVRLHSGEIEAAVTSRNERRRKASEK